MSPSVSNRVDLRLAFPCGRGMVTGAGITSRGGKLVCPLQFSYVLNPQQQQAARQFAGEIVGIADIKLIRSDRLELMFQSRLDQNRCIAIARDFRNRYIRWCNSHPDGTDSSTPARPRKSGQHQDNRDALRNAHTPAFRKG